MYWRGELKTSTQKVSLEFFERKLFKHIDIQTQTKGIDSDVLHIQRWEWDGGEEESPGIQNSNVSEVNK